MSTRAETILLTGAGGFLGRIFKESFVSKGFRVTTLGRSAENDIQCDLATSVPNLSDGYTWVVHNAGKAHIIPKSAKQIREFYNINCDGTRNLLTGVLNSGVLPESLVFISSVSVYGLTAGENISESQAPSAEDPYGQSKLQAENIILAWSSTHSVRASVLRLPLVAGENPPGNLRSMIQGIKKGVYLQIRRSKARKSMVLAEDVADFIPVVVKKEGIYNLTDGYHPSVAEIEQVIVKQTQAKKLYNIPYFIGWVLGLAGDGLDFFLPGKSPITSAKIKKIVSTLTFDDEKARRELGWNPRRVIDEFVL